MDEKFTVVLSPDDLNTVMEALGELPFKRVYHIIKDIDAQATEQQGLARKQREEALKAFQEGNDG